MCLFSGGWDVCLFERAERLVPVGRKGRRLVFRDSLCICNGVSPEMLVWATVEACSRAAALSLRQFCLPLAKGRVFDIPGGHSERPIFLIFSSFLLISQLLHGTSVEIRVVLSMSRFFYCEGAITRRHHHLQFQYLFHTTNI